MTTKVCPRCGLATCGVFLAGIVAGVQTAHFAKAPLDAKERGMRFPAAAVPTLVSASTTSAMSFIVTLAPMGGAPVVRPPMPIAGQTEQLPPETPAPKPGQTEQG
jgi:hypothetical protein